MRERKKERKKEREEERKQGRKGKRKKKGRKTIKLKQTQINKNNGRNYIPVCWRVYSPCFLH